MSTERYHEGRRAGVRLAIDWLHREALTMDDPHAREILNCAGFHLGLALKSGYLVRAKLPKRDIQNPPSSPVEPPDPV